jgi:myo-inositol-1(or 4)-monophosphatase
MSDVDALAADWLGASRRAAEGLGRVLADTPTSQERVRETGSVGEGGDRTLVIDERAEDAVFAELERLHDEGARFTALSEERGSVGFGDERVRVVIDPLDGSLNAKRGLPHVAVSIAVADGPTMADVAFGFVADLSTGEEWAARRGEGTTYGGAPLPAAPPERRDHLGRLEVVALEQADPRNLVGVLGHLTERAHRVRALGAMAISICQVAQARVDGMVSLWRCRAVDVAAGQLIVRESGGHVAFGGLDDPLAAPLGLEAGAPIACARTEAGLAELLEVVGGR